jgi:hypothetical protein
MSDLHICAVAASQNHEQNEALPEVRGVSAFSFRHVSVCLGDKLGDLPVTRLQHIGMPQP